MRYSLFCLLFGLLALPTSANASEDWSGPVSCRLISAIADSTIDVNKAHYRFEFAGISETNSSVAYSIDGVNHNTTLGNDNSLTPELAPGKHIFEFLIDGYAEVFTDSLQTEPQYVNTYQLSFGITLLQDIETPYVTYKPVIYLYPEERTDISVNIDIHGSEKFLYPTYKDSWEFTASPNGDLTFGNETYNYLFWEAKSSNSVLLDAQTSGFFVEKNDVVSFLEDKLTQVNLTSKEKADFITFWGPRLMQNELNFVHFIFNETCDQYADLNISPQPDRINRIYILWAPVNEKFAVSEQVIPSFDRSGFHVLEWGGQEQTLSSKTAAIWH